MTAAAITQREQLGYEVPRLFTPPLLELTPATTLGFECVEFARDTLRLELDPWERWVLLHALELRDGELFRFRTLLLLVSRQNGKTFLLKVVVLFLLLTGRARLVLGVAQSIGIAREVWQECVDLLNRHDHLRERLVRVRNVNGEQEFVLDNGGRYKIAANNRSAGRGLSVDVLVMDELREHRSWDAWAALAATTSARPNALTICSSNAGDSESVVLWHLRDLALAGDDPTLGLMEYSAPDGCATDDLDGLAQANPSLGYGRLTLEVLLSSARLDPPAVFRVERMCQRVDSTDAAVDPAAWRACADPTGQVDEAGRLVAGFDVSPTSGHATLVVASQENGRVRVEVAGAWTSAAQARDDLAELVARTGVEAVAWFGVSGAALAPLLRSLPGSAELSEAKAREACQHFAGLVEARRLLHPSDPLLDVHVAGSHRYRQGDGWRFSRYGQASCDAAYACAGAALLAESLAPVERRYSGPLVV